MKEGRYIYCVCRGQGGKEAWLGTLEVESNGSAMVLTGREKDRDNLERKEYK